MITAEYYANKILMNEQVKEIPVTVNEIERILTSKGWELIPYDINDEDDVVMLKAFGIFDVAKSAKGICFRNKKLKNIFYREDLSASEKALVLAHELGHIELGHISNLGQASFLHTGLMNSTQENEADNFALSLLAPSAVLLRNHIRTAEDISSVTLLNMELAKLVETRVRHKRTLTDTEQKLISVIQVEHIHKEKRYISVLLIALISLLLLIGIIDKTNIFTSVSDISVPSPATPQATILITPHPSLLPTLPPTTKPIYESSQSDPQAETVVVTRTGNRYHLSNCRYVRNKTDTITMQYNEAINSGYTPCKVCIVK